MEPRFRHYLPRSAVQPLILPPLESNTKTYRSDAKMLKCCPRTDRNKKSCMCQAGCDSQFPTDHIEPRMVVHDSAELNSVNSHHREHVKKTASTARRSHSTSRTKHRTSNGSDTQNAICRPSMKRTSSASNNFSSYKQEVDHSMTSKKYFDDLRKQQSHDKTEKQEKAYVQNYQHVGQVKLTGEEVDKLNSTKSNDAHDYERAINDLEFATEGVSDAKSIKNLINSESLANQADNVNPQSFSLDREHSNSLNIAECPSGDYSKVQSEDLCHEKQLFDCNKMASEYLENNVSESRDEKVDNNESTPETKFIESTDTNISANNRVLDENKDDFNSKSNAVMSNETSNNLQNSAVERVSKKLYNAHINGTTSLRHAIFQYGAEKSSNIHQNSVKQLNPIKNAAIENIINSLNQKYKSPPENTTIQDFKKLQSLSKHSTTSWKQQLLRSHSRSDRVSTETKRLASKKNENRVFLSSGCDSSGGVNGNYHPPMMRAPSVPSASLNQQDRHFGEITGRHRSTNSLRPRSKSVNPLSRVSKAPAAPKATAGAAPYFTNKTNQLCTDVSEGCCDAEHVRRWVDSAKNTDRPTGSHFTVTADPAITQKYNPDRVTEKAREDKKREWPDMHKTQRSLPHMQARTRSSTSASMTTKHGLDSLSEASCRWKTGRSGPPAAVMSVTDTLNKLNSSEWTDVVAGLNNMACLAQSNTNAIRRNVRAICAVLCRHTNSLRSHVARTAIRALTAMFQHAGKTLETELDMLVPVLLRRTGGTCHFIRSESSQALAAMVDTVAPSIAMAQLLNAVGGWRNNSDVVRSAMQLLLALVTRHGAQRALACKRHVVDTLVDTTFRLADSGDQTTRQTCRAIIRQWLQAQPAEALISRHLNGNMRATARAVINKMAADSSAK